MKNNDPSSLEEEDSDNTGVGEDESGENEIETGEATPDDIDEDADSRASGGDADALDYFFRQLGKPKNRPMPKDVFAALARRLADLKSLAVGRVKEIVACRMLEDESHDRTACPSCSRFDALSRELAIPGDLKGFCELSAWANGLLGSGNFLRLFRFFGLAEAERIVSDMCRVNFQLVASIAKHSHWRWRGVPLIELIQEGNRGLILAVIRFNPERGYNFSTYATWWIRHYVNREPYEYGNAIRVPIHVAAFFGRVCKLAAQRGLDLETAGDNDIVAIARQTKTTVAKINEIIVMIAGAQKVASLDQRAGLYEDGETLLERTADQTVAAPDRLLEEEEGGKVFKKEVMGVLSPRERIVVDRFYGLDGRKPDTLKNIGKRIGVSHEWVRVLREKALKKLRRALAHNQIDL